MLRNCLVIDGLDARVIEAAARNQVALIRADSVKTDESSTRVVDGLIGEDGNVMAARNEESTTSAVEIIPHGVPRIGLVEGTSFVARASVPGVTNWATIVGKGEPIALTVSISNGKSSDISGLEEEISPDWCLTVTKVKGIETDISLQMDVGIFTFAGAA